MANVNFQGQTKMFDLENCFNFKSDWWWFVSEDVVTHFDLLVCLM